MKKFTIVLLLLFCLKTFAQPAGWKYAMPITVKENSAAQVLNYQLKLTVNTQALISAGKMNASGNDIRFWKNCAGSSSFNYWIEAGINTATTTIWVKIDTLAASATKTIFMFYGNSAAVATSTIPGTFIGPFSSTDSVATGGSGGSAGTQRGFRFQPNEDILVTHFGKKEPNGTLRYVTLFDFTSTAIITQTTVSGPSAQFNYGPIASPLWLITGTQYVLELFQDVGDGYYFGTSSAANSRITYLDMRYCNSCTQNTFPTSVLANFHYGYPDFWFYAKKNVTPAPTYTMNSESGVTAVSSSTILCSGLTATITASGATTYSWNTGATTSVIAVSPTITSTYTVMAVDASGCTPSNTVSIVVNICTNVQNFAASNSTLLVYPNPGNGEYTVHLSSVSDNTFIEVYNSLGQIILKEKAKELNTPVNLKNKTNGIYILKVIENGKPVERTKIIKQ